MRRYLSDDTGTVALEMGLVFPFYLLIILSIFAIAFLVWTENSIQYAVAAAARCAVVDTTACGTSDAVKNAAIGWSYGVLGSGDTGKVTVNLAATCSTGESGASVKIQYPVTFFVISTTVAAEACFPNLS